MISNPSFFCQILIYCKSQPPSFSFHSPIISNTQLLLNPWFFLAKFWSTVCLNPIFFSPLSNLIHRYYQIHIFFFGPIPFCRLFQPPSFSFHFPIKSNIVLSPGALQIEAKKDYYSITLFSTSPIFCYVNTGRNKGSRALIRGRVLIRENMVCSFLFFFLANSYLSFVVASIFVLRSFRSTFRYPI